MAAFGVVASLSYRNIWRNKKRSLITLFAVTMGLWSCATLSTLAHGLSWGMAEETIKTLTGHIQIQAPEYREDPSVDHSFLMSSLNTSVFTDERISHWTARIRVPAVILSERESFGTTLVGINPDDEKLQSFIGSSIIDGEPLAGEEDPGIVVGQHLLDLLQTNIGKRVVLMSQNNHGELAEQGFRIKGVYKSNLKSTELSYVFIGRKVAQELLKIDDSVTEISLIAKDAEQIPNLIEKLKPHFSNLSVLSWGEMSPFVSALLKLQSEFIGFLFLLVFIAVSFGVVNTLLMAVFERTHEIGLLRAIGMKPHEIISQVILESVYLVLIGAVCGNVIAWGTFILLSRSGVDISFFAQGAEHFGSGRVIFPVMISKDWLQINLIVLVMGILSGIYPAWKASQLNPVEALTKGAR